MAILNDGDGQLLLEIGFKSPQIPVRIWTGEGNLTYKTNVYLPGKLMDVGETQVAISSPQSLPYFTQALTQSGDRLLYLNQDPGPLKATITWIWKLPTATAWTEAFKVEGRLSDVEFTPVNSLLTVSIEPLIYDINHGETLGWNHADQLRRNSTDRGMEYINKLDQGIRWPP